MARHRLKDNKKFNSSPPGRHFADNIFKCIFVKDIFVFRFNFLLKFVTQGPIAALIQVMAWGQTGDKPVSEPKVTHFSGAYMRH